MRIHRFKATLAAVLAASACLLLAAPVAMADKGAYKLEGAWVSKVVGFPGQWSYVLAPDPSGRQASGHGSVDIGFDPALFGCKFEKASADTPILISIKMTGPDTSAAYSIWYALSSSDPASAHIVFIGEVRTDTKFVAPGKSESTHYFSFYRPDQDLDPADGFPDEGETPACAAPVALYTMDTRVPAP